MKGICPTSKMSVEEKEKRFFKKKKKTTTNPPLAEQIIFNLGEGDSKVSPKSRVFRLTWI